MRLRGFIYNRAAATHAKDESMFSDAWNYYAKAHQAMNTYGSLLECFFSHIRIVT
jgi:hypothetical protein